jgi:mannose-6-phosphate isomerase-like protein (cupin superfamily)
MNSETKAEVRVTRWRGGQHPTAQAISQILLKQGLRPYNITHGPHNHQAARSHGHNRVLYCVEGSMEVVLPDLNQKVQLRPGDSIDLPRGVRYATRIPATGARCLEAERQVAKPITAPVR